MHYLVLSQIVGATLSLGQRQKHPRNAHYLHVSGNVTTTSWTTNGTKTSSCVLDWVAYVRNDLENVKKVTRSIDSEIAWRWEHHIGERDENITKYETETSILWAQLPTQCDNLPRITSAEAVTRTATITYTIPRPIYNATEPTYEGLDPWLSPILPFPTCNIPTTDCEPGWKTFLSAFQKMTVKQSEILSSNEWDVICGDPRQGIECHTDDILDIKAWIKFRGYLTLPNFFSGCSQAEEVCLAQWAAGNGATVGNGLGPLVDSEETKAVYDPGCNVHAERFVLIYFEDSTQRTNSTSCPDKEEPDSNVRTASSHLPVTTTLDSIVFAEKHDVFGFETGYFGDLVSETISIPASTMYGKFTFTSPSVYLAYDTIAADGWCSHPGKPLVNGILTLHSSELFSVIPTSTEHCTTGLWDDMWYGAAVIGKPQTWCSTVEQSTTRPFNLKDLRGPVPSSAYFDALPSLHKQLGARGVCRETICEDFYFPNIAMPTVVTELEPAFARCNPFAQNKHFKKPWYWVNGVWDPPIAFPIATAVKTLTMSDWAQSQTATPGAAIPELVAQPTEAPSRSETRPEAPSRPDMQSEAHLPDFAGRSTTQASILPKTTPITTITAKNAEITVFLNPNPQYVAAIESQLIRPGDPPSIIEGQTFSLNPNGHIIINGVQTIQLPKPGFPSAVHISTTIVRIDKNLFTATIFPSQNGVSGYIAIGSVTLHPGGSQVDVGGKTIRLGTDGVLLDGAIPIASLTSYGYTTSPTPEDEREGSIRYTTAKDYKVNAEKSGGIRSNGVSRSIGVSGCIIFGLFILVYFLE